MLEFKSQFKSCVPTRPINFTLTLFAIEHVLLTVLQTFIMVVYKENAL